MSHLPSFEYIDSPETNSDVLKAEEVHLFERLREKGKKFVGILAFTTVFAGMVEGGAFAHADEMKPPEQKIEKIEKNKSMEKVDVQKMIEEGKSKESPVQERPITYCADGDTMGRLMKSGVSIEGNTIILGKQSSMDLRLVEKNGVYTKSVTFESSERDNKIIIELHVLNSDQTEEKLMIVDGVLVDFEKSTSPNENKEK
ncbi:MAG: hypothetical protein AAB652_01710 [Patescibacteria group bacterium]